MYASPKLWEKVWIKLNEVEWALRGKGIACVRAFNLFAILFKNAGSLATKSSVLSLQHLMETTHFSEWLTWTVSSVTNTRHSFNIFSAFFCPCSHNNTHSLLSFIHTNFSISSLCSWDLHTLLFFNVEIDIPFVWMRKVPLKRKTKLLPQKWSPHLKRKYIYFHYNVGFATHLWSGEQLLVLIALQICK